MCKYIKLGSNKSLCRTKGLYLLWNRKVPEDFQTTLTCELLTSCACCSASWIFTYHLILLSNASQIAACALCHGRHGAARPAETQCFGSSVAGKSLKCMNTAFTRLRLQNRAQPLFIFYFKKCLSSTCSVFGFVWVWVFFFSDWTLSFAGLDERSFCPAGHG